eukprot:PhM_4_TR13987/c0_g1_i1/m.81747
MSFPSIKSAHGPSSSSSASQLEQWLSALLDASNLDLPQSEKSGLIRTLITTNDKDEIRMLCGAMLGSDEVGETIIKRRFAAASEPPVAYNKAVAAHTPTEDTTSTGIYKRPKKVLDPVITHVAAAEPAVQGGGKKKGKKGMRKLDDADGGVIVGIDILCGCMASTHPFLLNCLNCGRIICKQEGDTKCFYCNLDPKVNVMQVEKEKRSSIESVMLFREQEARAKADRDRLLTYARDKVKRTTVIDDQADHYDMKLSSAWVTPEERAAAAKQQKESFEKLNKLHQASGAYTVHLDLLNQNIALGARHCESTAKTSQSIEAKESTAAETSSTVSGVSRGTTAVTESSGMHTATTITSSVGLGFQHPAYRIDLKPMEAAPSFKSKAANYTSNQEADDDDDGHLVIRNPFVDTAVFYRPSAEDPVPLDRGTWQPWGEGRVQNEYFEEDDVTWKVAVDAVQLEKKKLGLEPMVAAPPPPKPSKPSCNDEDEPSCAAAAVPDAEDEDEDSIEVQDVDGPADAAPPQQSVHLRPQPVPDTGMCMTMHQPWASLLVAGLKRFEGRSWPTDYRGRLWIHAGATRPVGVAEIEDECRLIYPDAKFPRVYPTGVLVGCVDVVDCLSREEYLEKVPKEEQEINHSDYLFVCKNPQRLAILHKMDGKPKLYKLDKKLWNAAKKQVKK